MLFIPVLLTQVFIFTLMKRERMKANLFISPSVCFFCFLSSFIFCSTWVIDIFSGMLSQLKQFLSDLNTKYYQSDIQSGN